ncbi:hypothetical protein [Marisediminicola sp. LYQ134]|uniref:hypothetical protein n=1 Tax=unclassified Marisediminicola TaxID=2618316 RepID=UPI003982E7C1
MSALSNGFSVFSASARAERRNSATHPHPPQSPDGVPELSRGRHRNAKRGACFMEFASYLAGEKFSDHPACTHPALAGLARLVNDWTRDSNRSKLAPLIPSVIGVVTTGPRAYERIELDVAVRAGAAALAIASESRQRALAVGLIRGHARLAAVDPAGATAIRELVRSALAAVPLADAWARAQLAATRTWSSQSFDFMYGAMVSLAVASIAEACVDDSDSRLRLLLEDTITACREIVDSAGPESAGSSAGTPARGSERPVWHGFLTHA